MKSVKVNIVQLDPENYEYYGYNVFLNQNDSAQFIFPDKKLLYSPVLPIDNEAQKSEAVIIGNDIYLQYFSQPYWIHVKNGDTVPILIPGMHATHDIDNYMDGWDLTKNIEKITEDLGVEEINGRKLRHYKVKITKIPVDSMNNLSEGERYFLNYILGLNFESLKETSVDINKENEDILKIVDNNIRYVFDGNEIIIPLPESLSIPIMYQFVGVGGYEDDPSSWDFDIKTWAIEAEIWVGEEDFLVYKEKYRTEHSEFNYYPNDSEEEKKEKEEYPWEQDQVYEDGLEIVYSDFNTDIKIEIPTENVIEIDEYLKQFGYSSQEDYREDAVMVKIEERDYKRKSDLQGIRSDLNDFMYSQAENKKPPYYPNTNNILQKINDNSSVLQTLVPEYIDSLPVDIKNPEYYYTYKSDGFEYELLARLENLEDRECKIKNGICLYIVKDGSPERCAGSVQIESETCNNGKGNIKAKVSTTGNCPVEYFVGYFENSMSKLTHSDLGDNLYLVSMDSCKKIEKLLAVGEGGFSINK